MSSVETSEGMSPHEIAQSVPPIEITSQDGSIRLRQYVPEDAAAAYRLIRANAQHLSQHGDTTGRKYEDEEAFRKSITDPENPDRLRFGIWNEQGRLVGSINLTPDADDPTKGEVGYYLARMDTGRGIAQKAVEALVSYAFNERGYHEVRGRVHPNNTGSVKTLHNAGFTLSETGKHMLTFTRKVSVE